MKYSRSAGPSQKCESKFHQIRFILVASTLILFVQSTLVKAEQITATVEAETQAFNGFPGGKPIVVTYTFEDLPPFSEFPPHVADYYASSFVISIDGQEFTGVNPSIRIKNDICCVGTNFRDNYLVFGQVSGLFDGNIEIRNAGIQLERDANPNNTVTSTALPLSTDTLNAFSWRSIFVSFTVLDTGLSGVSHGIITSLRFDSSNTTTGEDVTVSPEPTDENGDPVSGAPSVSLGFDEVTGGGDTTVTVTEQGPPPPSGFRLGNPPIYLDLETDATFTGPVDICIDYSNISYGGNPDNLKLAHFENGAWVDITSSNNTTDMIICGTTNSLSPFAIFETADPIVLLGELVDEVAALNAKKGIINSLDSKLQNAKEALTDAKTNNDHSAINVLLSAFSNSVSAQRGKALSDIEADGLLTRAEEIALVLAGDPVL